MTIFRVQHNKNYTSINNTICSDKRISWKARGIWLYAFSKPDDWTFYLQDLINQTSEKKGAVNSGLKELEKCGYLRRTRIRNSDGTLGEANWCFFETPTEEIQKKLPKAKNPTLDNPRLDNQPLLSTELLPSTEVQGAIASEEKIAKSPPLSQSEQKKSEDTEVLKLYCTSNSLNIKLDTLRRWHHRWGCDRINRNLALLAERVSEGKQIGSHEKWMEVALKGDYGQDRENEEKNRESVLRFLKGRPHLGVKVTKKYVVHAHSGIEIYFKLPPKDFAEQFKNLGNKTRG